MNRSASTLIQAGFNSRLEFTAQLAKFRNQKDVDRVLESFAPREEQIWSNQHYEAYVTWNNAPPPPGRIPIALYNWNAQPIVLSPEGLPLGVIQSPLNPNRRGLVRASTSIELDRIDLSYIGPEDLWRKVAPS